MALISLVLVIAALNATSKFALMYQELGVQMPTRTGLVLQVWPHVIVWVVLLIPGLWRMRTEDGSWPVRVWFLLLLIYGMFLASALFAPLMFPYNGLTELR